MTGEKSFPESGDELIKLWDALPPADGSNVEAIDTALVRKPLIGVVPGAIVFDLMDGVLTEIAGMDTAQIDALFDDPRRASSITDYLREVLPALNGSDTASPVPLQWSVHLGNTGGLSQDEWNAMPESTKRLFRTQD